MGNVRFATIGTSAICNRFIDALGQVSGAELVGCYSRTMEGAHAFGEKHGATLFFDSLDELAACDQVDAVYVASPNALHAGQAKAMVAAGKHVLVEKAFASNEVEAADVFAAADAAGVVAMEAMRNLHVPTFDAIRAQVAGLGPVGAASFSFAKVTSRIGSLRAGEKCNIFDPAMSAGALMDMGIYCVAPALALFGRPQSVAAAGVTTGVPGVEAGADFSVIDLSGSIALGYADKVVALSYGKTYDDKLDSQVCGEKATLVFDSISCPTNLRLFSHEDKGQVFRTEAGQGAAIDCDQPPANDMACEVQIFVNAVLGDESSLERVAWGREVTLGTLAVIDDARRQMGVEFPADRAGA